MPAFHLALVNAASFVAFTQAVPPTTATPTPSPPPPLPSVTTDASPPSDQPAVPSITPVVPALPVSAVPVSPAAPAAVQTVIPFASLEDGMGVRSADEDFSLAVHLLMQARYEHVEREEGRDDGFRLVLVRPALRGNVFRPWLQYFVQFELATAPALLDAEIIAQPVPELGLKVGQFLTPFSREFLVPPGALLFPDFAPSNVQFRDNRDTGAMLFGALFRRHIEYFVAAVNGNGINKGGNDNAQPELIGRLVGNLVGKNAYTEIPQLLSDDVALSVGVSGSHSYTEQTSTSIDPTTNVTTTARLGSAPTTKGGADLAFSAGPFSLQAEGYTRTIESGGGAPRSVGRGGFAQVGLFIVPKTLELAARGDLVQLDVTHKVPANKRADGAVAYYLRDNHLKLQAAYAWAENRAAAIDSPATISHTVTVQAQVWF